MRGLIALCVGLGLVLGAGAAWAEDDGNDCCLCACTNIGVVTCEQEGFIPCGLICGQRGEEVDPEASLCFVNTRCLDVPSCPQSAGRFPAPTAGTLGIAALLIALGGFGAWRLRKRAA